MASLVDLSSSPDPLGDEAPSSIRPITRRTAGNLKINQRESSLQLPSSIARARPVSTGKSPRKQTFELDVGNERSPQRLLVTVEADDERGRHSAVSRRLFTASPTRSISRRREATNTTTVPLRGLTDDEGGDNGDAPVPRRRGRPRGSLGSKNGTPNPRGKKRSGTPMQKSSPAKRHSGEAPSDPTLHSDALQEASGNLGADPTPKPKARTRKTPKKAATPAVPSSNPTGRKRGRPRKALLPEEVADIANEVDNRTNAHANSEASRGTITAISREARSNYVDQIDEDAKDSDTSLPQVHEAVRSISPPQENTVRSQAGPTKRRSSGTAARSSHSDDEASTHQARTDDFDDQMFGDFAGEAYSDFESEAGQEDGITYSGQDNLTHASEFSMIDVEALPSFQASFQSHRSSRMEETHPFAEAGDETNFIINQTLESLRRSTQSEAQDATNLGDAKGKANNDLQHEAELPKETQNSPPNYGSSQISWTQSPRRQQRGLPLSRQVFSNRAPHVDDSFSSIPDSILRAATPGRLPMAPTVQPVVDDDSNMYEDSFSEVPEEVLMAATPRPVRTTTHMDQDENDGLLSETEAQSASRSTNIGSDRLPTPDDTNSSTTDAKTGHGEDTQRLLGPSSAIIHTSELNIRSSPPTISRQLNSMNIQNESAHTISRHFDVMAIESELSHTGQNKADTPMGRSPSPHAPQADSGSAKQPHLLQPPETTRRPTLSPIVRAGRTLQNIMSDRSSPDELGSSLGSPFRGSVQSDSRHSSVTRSPVRHSSHRRTGSDSRLLSNPMVSFSHSVRSPFGSSRRASTAPAPDHAPQVAVADGTYARDTHDHSQSQARRRSTQSNVDHSTNSHLPEAESLPQMPGSSAVLPPSEPEINELTSVLGEDDPSSPATQRSRRMSASQRLAHSSFVGTRVYSGLQHEVHEEEADEEEEDQVQDEDGQTDEGAEGNVADDDVQSQHDAVSQDDEAEVEDIGNTVPGASFSGIDDVDDGDDMDLWDIEASRPTPRPARLPRPEVQEQTQSQTRTIIDNSAPMSATLQAAAELTSTNNPPRRNKIPSPWRRNTRRLIYQKDFRSPSEIDMEDSPPSDVDRATSIPRPTLPEEGVMKTVAKPSQEQVLQEVVPQELLQNNPSQEEMSEEELSQDHILQETLAQEQLLGNIEFEDQHSREGALQNSINPEQEEFETGFEDDDTYDLMGRDESDEPQSPPHALGSSKSDPPIVENSILQEYSMLSQASKSPEVHQEKPPPPKKSFFGNFDIMSFFSSPRPLPTSNNPPTTQTDQTPVHKPTTKPLPRTNQSIDKSAQDEPRSALRATGLFPSIRQKVFNPSPARRQDLFSPGSALRSSDTVADTYAETPSTPERHYPTIPQKRNFTPLSDQSRNTASLFTPSRQESTPADDVRTPSPEYDDEHEESIVTDGPSFEHIPPREKPSQWDRNLSPSKSCLRSPLKPKTPGRVVEFTSNVLSPGAQANVRANQQRVPGSVNNGGAKIATVNPRTAILNPTPLRIPASFRSQYDNDKENTQSLAEPPAKQLSQSAQLARSQVMVSPVKLSPTTWSRAHWIRLDEILQLRKKDPMQFQMLFSAVGPGHHPLSGLEVAVRDAKMILEDWHMEVVEAFRSEVVPPEARSRTQKAGGQGEGDEEDVMDASSLSKRLFALIIGEERRRSGTYVSGQSQKAGIGPAHQDRVRKAVR